jgi:RNA polymerase sigma-70 factor, ECF subfamily
MFEPRNGIEFRNFPMDYPSLQPEELIQLCAQTGQAPAWEEFIRRFNPLIARVVLKTANRWGEFSPSVLDDLVQETYLKLCAENCRLLRTFEFRKPEAIYGYLKVVTANIVHDHFKSARAAKRGSGEVAEDIEVVGSKATSASQPSLLNQASIERTILLQEIDHYLARLVPVQDLPRSRLIFWLYFRSGLSAGAIASLPNIGLSTKGVESILFRLTRLLRAALAEPAGEPKKDTSGHQKGLRQAESF